ASTRLSRLLARPGNPKDLSAARTNFETLTSDYRELQVRIRQESPEYAALTQPSPLTAAGIQRDLLDADTVLLEYTLGERRSWLWAVTPDRIASYELPGRAAIEAPARRLLGLVTARQPREGEALAARTRRVAAADRDWRRESIALGHTLLAPA